MTKSFVVVRKNNHLVLEESYWKPGYTNGFKSTAQEAINHAWDELQTKREQVEKDENDLLALTNNLSEKEQEAGQ